MTIDTIAERYGILPSQVMNKATTFDLWVCETAIGYRNALHDRELGRNKPVDPNSYSQDDLMQILEETRGQSQNQ